MTETRPDGTRWANDCDLCSNSRLIGLYPHEHECPWCRSVRLAHGSYWYPITKSNEHLFRRPVAPQTGHLPVSLPR